MGALKAVVEHDGEQVVIRRGGLEYIAVVMDPQTGNADVYGYPDGMPDSEILIGKLEVR